MPRFMTRVLIPAMVLVTTCAYLSLPATAQGQGFQGRSIDQDALRFLQAEQQMRRIRYFLPGNESTFYVLALQTRDGTGKHRQIALYVGKEATAKAIFDFYKDQTGGRKKFEYRAFNNPAVARAYFSWMTSYSLQAGYR